MEWEQSGKKIVVDAQTGLFFVESSDRPCESLAKARERAVEIDKAEVAEKRRKANIKALVIHNDKHHVVMVGARRPNQYGESYWITYESNQRVTRGIEYLYELSDTNAELARQYDAARNEQAAAAERAEEIQSRMTKLASPDGDK